MPNQQTSFNFNATPTNDFSPETPFVPMKSPMVLPTGSIQPQRFGDSVIEFSDFKPSSLADNNAEQQSNGSHKRQRQESQPTLTGQKTPQPQQQDASTQLINKLQSFHIAQQEQLQKMAVLQKQILLNPQKESYEMLNNQQEQLKRQLDAELKALVDLERTVLLAPHEIRKVFYLQQQLVLQIMQLELYHQELTQLLSQSNMPARW